MALSPTEILLGILVVLLAALALVLWMRNRRTAQLKSTFGPEYSRTVHEVGSESKAESLLAERQKRVAGYTIKPLPQDMREHFTEAWKHVQTQFVDDPSYAVTRADDLLGEVMTARGYPVKDFEQQSADLSVHYPKVVQNYRTAHDIAVRHSNGEAGTEDLRKAMIHYRELFEELTAEAVPQSRQAAREEVRHGSKH